MQKIITITLNPSLDKGTTVLSIVPEKKLQCSTPVLEPGGGGINVSRALDHLGCKSLALYMCGGYTGGQFKKMMEDTDIECVAFDIAKNTRENLIVVDSTSHKQYRFGMKGPTLKEEEWQQPLLFLQNNSGYDYVVASGSLPPGVPLDFFARMAAIVHKKGAKLILDTSGEALKNSVKEGVFLIKPNLAELSLLIGVDELKDDEVVLAARTIIDDGCCSIVVVSLGAKGAMLITKNETIQVPSPEVGVKSTVGAGDSMVAGLVLGITKGYSWKDVLRMGIACGTAATMNFGTALCSTEDVERLYNDLQKINN
jgi:6-phosphofructokinase 2